MTETEQRLLGALARMCEQYLTYEGALDHLFMGAGEEAVEVLAEYGLVKPEGRGGTWTDAAQPLLRGGGGWRGPDLPYHSSKVSLGQLKAETALAAERAARIAAEAAAEVLRAGCRPAGARPPGVAAREP